MPGSGLTLMTIGGAGMYAATVVLQDIQTAFVGDRAAVSLPYTLVMVGVGLGGIWMGRLSDRFGVATCLAVGTVGLSAGLVAAGLSGGIGWFNLVQGLLIGLLGTSATFAPLVADTSRWFTRRREIGRAHV